MPRQGSARQALQWVLSARTMLSHPPACSIGAEHSGQSRICSPVAAKADKSASCDVWFCLIRAVSPLKLAASTNDRSSRVWRALRPRHKPTV